MTNQLPVRPTHRDKVFDIIDGERDYQVKTRPESPVPTLVDETNLLIEYTDKLAVDVTVDSASPQGGPLKRLREIATIAIRAMENHGAQPRENHVPASAGITGTVKIVGGQDSTKPKPRVNAVEPSLHPAPTAHAPATLVVEHNKLVPVTQHTTQHGGEQKK